MLLYVTRKTMIYLFGLSCFTSTRILDTGSPSKKKIYLLLNFSFQISNSTLASISFRFSKLWMFSSLADLSHIA
jgi:hypothetical protein